METVTATLDQKTTFSNTHTNTYTNTHKHKHTQTHTHKHTQTHILIPTMKNFLALLCILALGCNVYSQAIGITSPVSSTSYCAGSSGIVINYTISGTFSNTPSPNVFSAQISDPVGSFGGSPVTIGTVASVSGGSISCTLPSTLLTSGLYRFRVISSNPAVNGSDNGVNLTIFAIALNTPSTNSSSFCQGETFTVNFSQSSCNFVNTPSANVYSVELSNASGSFTNPVVIGTLTGTTPAAITCTLPGGTAAGNGYRLRIAASSPPSTGSDNGSNISVQAAAGNPTVVGIGTWNVHCFATRNNYINNYRGYYTENNLSFTTTTRWANTASPSSANATSGLAYTGCSIGTTDYSYCYKRTNIPCGYYQIDIPSRRNEVYILINGVTVYQNTVCCAAVTNAWRGVIQTTDNLEIRSSNLSPQGFLTVNFTKLNQLTMSAPVTICASTNASLSVVNTGTLPVTYSWAPAGSLSSTTGSAVVANPAVTTQYTVTALASGCSVFTNSVTVTVNALPTTNTSINTTVICSGFQTSNITATGANTYSWAPPTGLNTTTGNSVIASPTVTTIYTVTGSNNCSTLNATRTVSVQNVPSSPSPTLFGNAVWNVFCYNSSSYANLFGYYTENNLSFNTTSRWANTLSPSSANSSSGSAYTGCNLTNAAHGTIYKRTNFTCGYYRIDLVHNDFVLLAINGATVFQNATAATDNGVWTGFLGTSSTVEIRHANTTGNTSALSASFVPVTFPSLSPPFTTCSGTSATLTAGFAAGLSYSWTPSTALSTTTGTITMASPTVVTVYTCTVTDPTTSCSSSASTTVTVNALATTSVTPTSATVNCASQTYTLIAGGANTYSWLPTTGLSSATGYSVVASPTVSTTYTVTGNNNCSTLNATVFVSVVPLVNPTVFPSGTWNAYCYNSTTFTNYFGYYTENGSGTSGYDFNTATRWASAAPPSNATAVNGNAYLGCTMPATNWSMSFKRTGFSCNTYSIQVPNNDDNLTVFINGTQVATRAASTNSATLWVGVLSSSTTVELRLTQLTTGSGLNILFTPAAAVPSLAVWSGATSNNWFTSSNWCGSAVPSASTDVLIYNSGTLFQPAINLSGATCNNLTISPAVSSNGTLSAIGASSLSLTGAFGINVYGSWINNGSFTTGTGTISLLGSASRTLMCLTTQTFNTLVLNTTGTITITSGTHLISNNMNLTSGIIQITGGTLRFLNGATATNASNASYIDGTIVKFGNQAFTFPLGSGGYYRPIGISAPVSTTDNFTAVYNNVDPSPSFTNTSKDATIDHISSCEHWILNRTGGSSAVNVTLSWDANSCGVSVLPDLVVARWDAGQVKWKDQGNGGTTGNTTSGTVVSGSLVSVFSPFTLGSKTVFNALPIELLDFSATCSETGVQLNWSTASERNNHYFCLERSEDGNLWKEVTKISPQKNVASQKKYTFTDPSSSDLLEYYRLSQIDYDGRKTIFKTVYANCDPVKDNFSFYPNPTNQDLTLLITCVSNRENGLLKIIDSFGKVVYSQKTPTVKGLNTLQLKLTLEPGIYFISYSSTTFLNSVHKLIIEH